MPSSAPERRIVASLGTLGKDVNRVRMIDVAKAGRLRIACVGGFLLVMLGFASCGGTSTSNPPPQGTRGQPATTNTAVLPTTSSSPPSSTTTQPAEPTGFAPADFTAISATQWWVLGCRQGECPYVASTSDGGDNWSIVGAPSAWGNPLYQPQPTIDNAMHLRFADANDGWAFGPGLYDTHDGGKTWSQLDLGGAVEDLEPGLGRVYAVVFPGPPSSACSSPRCPGLQLWSSPITSNAWSKVSVPEHFYVGSVAVLGDDVYLQVTAGGEGETTGLLISTDQGHRFTESAKFGTGYGCAISPVAETIWAFCPTGLEGLSLVSTNGGRTFTDAGFRQANGSDIAGVSASVAIAAAGAPGTPLWRTVDGGRTFTPVQSAPDGTGFWYLMGFTNPLDGYALWGDVGLPEASALWHTTDGGQHWSPETIQ